MLRVLQACMELEGSIFFKENKTSFSTLFNHFFFSTLKSYDYFLMLDVFGLILLLLIDFFFSAALFFSSQTKGMRYYLFMIHGWLSIDEDGTGMSKVKLANPLHKHHSFFVHSAINSHCIYGWWFFYFFSYFLLYPAALKQHFQRVEMREQLLQVSSHGT